MTKPFLIRFAMVFGLLSASSPLSAWATDDVIELKSGAHLSGKVSTKAKNLVLELGEGVRLAFDSGLVRNKREPRPEEAEYLDRAAKIEDTADAHWQLYKWCREKGLTAHAMSQAERVIELEPDHTEARAVLRYVRIDKEWVRQDDNELRKGRIRDGAKWRFPEEIEREAAAEKLEADLAKFSGDIKRAKQAIVSDGPQAGAAMAKLSAIQDPLVIPAFGEQLNDPKNPIGFRKFMFELLRKFDHPQAYTAIIRASVYDPDRGLRDSCLDFVAKSASSLAVIFYAGLLNNPTTSNADLNRAGYALVVVKDERVGITLIDKLVSEEKRVIKAGSNTNAGTSGDGSMGFGTGGKDKVFFETINNPGILAALRELYPEAPGNLLYNQAGWRQWYAERFFPLGRDLRRDP